ncbi:MAG: AAA family ATPase, partial [Acidobacteriota bacterium]|nr:AAA family ATPase [Acidobacteriota bacterium]
IRVVVGAGGVGKTTVAAALAVALADAGHRTLVMTFDPSRRLKDTLGIGERALADEVPVAHCGGRLHASLLDARQTFDGLIDRYAPDAAVRQRILGNRYYRHLAGSLAGILEYMAAEKLFEIVQAGSYERLVLDTPPVSQALDLLEAPERIVRFLDSGAVQFATRPWFDAAGRLKATRRMGRLGRRLEDYLDGLVGLDLLRDLVEFFTAFKPLFEGFRARAREVGSLLRRPSTCFDLVTTASEDRTHDTLFFARRLRESGLRLGSIAVNRLHPWPGSGAAGSPVLARLASAVADRERRALASVRELLGGSVPLVTLPLLAEEPVAIAGLRELAGRFEAS